jgi:hypothetical protein
MTNAPKGFEEVFAKVRAEREAKGLNVDGKSFADEASRDDYLRRKANAETSGRYANLPKE